MAGPWGVVALGRLCGSSSRVGRGNALLVGDRHKDPQPFEIMI
jgi:hypothetical protein